MGAESGRFRKTPLAQGKTFAEPEGGTYLGHHLEHHYFMGRK
jgi:hypothetical protein